MAVPAIVRGDADRDRVIIRECDAAAGRVQRQRVGAVVVGRRDVGPAHYQGVHIVLRVLPQGEGGRYVAADRAPQRRRENARRLRQRDGVDRFVDEGRRNGQLVAGVVVCRRDPDAAGDQHIHPVVDILLRDAGAARRQGDGAGKVRPYRSLQRDRQVAARHGQADGVRDAVGRAVACAYCGTKISRVVIPERNVCASRADIRQEALSGQVIVDG